MRCVYAFMCVLALSVSACGQEVAAECSRDEHCDDGDACNYDDCVVGLCRHTEKPCEVELNAECADLETYDCDPNIGMVECIWDTRSREGQGCCRIEGRCCSPPNGLPSCWTCCILGGVCSAGVCIDESGYIYDCAKLPDYSNCEIGDNFGFCWEDDCTVIDCGGVEDGTPCWFDVGAFEVGVCADGTCGQSPS